MAMTKKEKAEFDEAIRRAEMLAALRWTGLIERDVPVPKGREKPTSGWNYNQYTHAVGQAWSSPVAHGDGPNREYYGSGRQCGIALFSSKLLALRALRHAVELESAANLLKIDKAIEKE